MVQKLSLTDEIQFEKLTKYILSINVKILIAVVLLLSDISTPPTKPLRKTQTFFQTCSITI